MGGSILGKVVSITDSGAAVTDIDFRKQRRREFLGTFLTYTTEGQQSYVLRWRRWLKHLEVPGGGVLQEERSFVRAAGGYRKTLTRRFFGFGPRAGENDETSYTDQIAFVDIGMSRSLEGTFDDFIVDLGMRGEILVERAGLFMQRVCFGEHFHVIGQESWLRTRSFVT